MPLYGPSTLSEVLSVGSTTGTNNITMSNGQALRTTQVADNTYLMQAWDGNIMDWATFITLTSLAGGASCDLSNRVTMSGETIVFGSSPTVSNLNISNGGAIRTGTTAGNTVLFEARDVDGGIWKTFATMTANNTPTFDFDASVTIGGKLITSGFVASPAITNVTNVASSTIQDQQWMRIGSVINVSGRLTIDPTSASIATEVGVALPVSSTTNLFAYVSGVAHSSNSVSLGGGCEADITNNRMAIRYINTTDVASKTWFYNFTYRIN